MTPSKCREINETDTHLMNDAFIFDRAPQGLTHFPYPTKSSTLLAYETDTRIAGTG